MCLAYFYELLTDVFRHLKVSVNLKANFIYLSDTFSVAENIKKSVMPYTKRVIVYFVFVSFSPSYAVNAL